MSTVTIEREHWQTFFDRMSKGMLGKRAEVEVASLDLGDQITAEWLPLLGITYDSRDDLIDVAFDRANHLIRHPSQIVVDETAEGLASVAVVDAEGVRQVVRLKDPLRLLPSSTTS